MRSLSLRTRLLAGLATVAVVLTVVAWTVTSTTRRQLVDQIDDQLVAVADFERPPWDGNEFGEDRHDADTGAAADPGDAPAPDRPEPRERLSAMFEGFLRPDGTVDVVFESNLPGREYSDPDFGSAAPPDGRAFTVGSVDGDTRYRAIATLLGDGGWVVHALPLADVDDTVEFMILVEALGVGAVVLVLGAVAWWVIHLGVRPLEAMTDTATEIAAGDLSLRVAETASPSTESGALARALNVMLGRIESAVDERARSEERLRRFVADASHELRTPVTTIRGYAELYRHGGLGDPSELDDAMRRTEAEARRMGRLVEDMLALAKLDQERPLDVATVDIGRIVSDIARDAAVTAPDRRIDVTVGDDLSIEGDEDRLRQAIVNVVGNALVHTPAGTIVRLGAGRRSDDVVVTVADDGRGMDPDVAERITERFYRADASRSRERGGSGLGMAIVDAVIGAHDGTLTIDSAPGEGTTVTITLPAHRDD